MRTISEPHATQGEDYFSIDKLFSQVTIALVQDFLFTVGKCKCFENRTVNNLKYLSEFSRNCIFRNFYVLQIYWSNRSRKFEDLIDRRSIVQVWISMYWYKSCNVACKLSSRNSWFAAWLSTYWISNMQIMLQAIQVILAGTLTGVQGDIRCKVLAALFTVK